jgi:truncated hemoglobin YjbI/quinol monooxygenase YgiN
VITEYIRYRIADGDAAEFESAYARAAESLAAAPQCVEYDLARCVDEPACFVLRIVWTSAADHMDGFRKGEHFPAFFAAIRPYVERIEEMRHYEATPVAGRGGAPDQAPTLYEWAGGEEALRRLFTAFYRHVLDDELVGPLFAGMDPHHPDHVAVWLGEVFGGPDRYTRERGGYPRMLRQHLGRGISEAQRRRWVSLLHDAADEVGLPDDPEFRAAFAGYIEWGTRLAVANSRPGAEPIGEAPVPHWGWGVAPPWTG